MLEECSKMINKEEKGYLSAKEYFKESYSIVPSSEANAEVVQRISQYKDLIIK